MTRQYLQLSPYNWRLTVFYNIQPKDLEEVLITLWEYGCPNKEIRTVALTLQKRNTGFTYTNHYLRTSIMGIGWVTSDNQFINTIVHEIKHLQSDICNYYGISHTGEQASIISGDVAELMYTDFKLYLEDYGKRRKS